MKEDIHFNCTRCGHPLLQRNGALVNETVRRDIQLSRDTDAMDANAKLRLCDALELRDTALPREYAGFKAVTPAA